MKAAAQFFKTLADEARLQILWLLFNHSELCVCDIMDTLGITQSKTSRHLATLRHARLVRDRKDAAWTYYSLRPPENELEKAVLEVLRSGLANRPDATQILTQLHVRMDRIDRDAGCVVDGACAIKHSGKSVERANHAQDPPVHAQCNQAPREARRARTRKEIIDEGQRI